MTTSYDPIPFIKDKSLPRKTKHLTPKGRAHGRQGRIVCKCSCGNWCIRTYNFLRKAHLMEKAGGYEYKAARCDECKHVFRSEVPQC